MKRRGLAASLSLAATGLLACGADRGAEPAAPLEVHFAGCDQVSAGPVCRFDAEGAKRSLRLWLPTAKLGAPTISLDGVALTARWNRDATGAVADVALPPRARGLLTVTVEGDERTRAWAIEIGALPECRAVEEARALRSMGKPEEALAALEGGETDASCAARADSLAGRLLGNDLDRPEEGVRRLELAFEARLALEDWSGAVDDAQSLAYLLDIKLHRFDRVRTLIDEVAPHTASWAEGAAKIDFVRAQLAVETGNLREALRLYERVEIASGRLALHRLRAGARQERADLLAFLGRPNEAMALIERAVEQDSAALAACARANLLGNLGWSRFLAARDAAGRDESFEECKTPIMEALSLLDGACRNPFARAIALMNLAIIAAHRGRTDEAEALLARYEAVADATDAFTATWEADLRARLAMDRGDTADALRRYEEMIARAHPGTRALLQGRTGRADALLALGRREDAAAAYEEVERLLDAQLRVIPLDAGQGAFLDGRGASARRLVAAHLDGERIDAALEAVRRAGGRILRELERDSLIEGLAADALARWERGVSRYRTLTEELTARRVDHEEAAGDEQPDIAAEIARLEREVDIALDDLYAGLPSTRDDDARRPVPDGDLVLHYFELEEGWVAFASSTDGVTHALLPPFDLDGSPEELARALLSPFERRIESAERLVLVAFGELGEVDFHALPWRGDALIATLPVVYSLDLSGEAERAGEGPALVVTDPAGDLLGARESGALAAAALRGGPGSLEILSQTAADRGRVLAALDGAGLFHFAGHADSGGPDGWSSCLMLARDQRLSVGDVLSIPEAPGGVILEACDSGATSGESVAATLGVGQAFVLAGSRFAVVTSRPIADDAGARFSRHLYIAGRPSLERIRRALLELRRDCTQCDWSAFRILVP